MGRDSVKKQRVHGKIDAPQVSTAPLDLVRDEFLMRYATGCVDPTERTEATDKAWKRALQTAATSNEFASGSWNGREWIWSLDAGIGATRDG
jgi:hypothetical protein